MTDSFNIIMNPPYDGSLHLQILEKALTFKSDNGTCVCLHPARWIEDPLWEHKSHSDHEKYQKSIIDKLSSINFIQGSTASRLFNIGSTVDLCIDTFNNEHLTTIKVLKLMPQSILNKVLKYSLTNNIKSHIDIDKLDGWRIKICRIMHGAPQSSERSDKANIYYSTDEPLLNGYSKKGVYWTNLTSQSKGKSTIPASIKFNSEEEAFNYLNSIKTNFIKNYIMIVMWDVHVPHFVIPYMNDYSHIWTDEDYCKFFNLTKEESEFMCRKVDDYRVKDFIEYEEIY